MKVNPIIFRSYDIRGIYPKDLNQEVAFKVGQAFVQYTKAKKVVVGQDMRISSPALFESLSKGIINQGADLYDIGLVPTECLYFAVDHYNQKAGIMITASHNPKDYNGFKLVKKEKERVDMVSGKDLLEITKKDFSEAKKQGQIKKLDIWSDYIDHIFSFIEIEKIKPFRVVIDAGNGMAGKVIPLVKDKLPIKITPLNFELDGNFPAHPSNPLEQGSTDQISKEVKKQKADFGFIFDGDGDRIYLIDELGNFVRGDITLLLLAKYFLKKDSQKGIAYNLICSKAIPEFIKKWGGDPIRTPVGVVNVRKGMLEKKGIMGGEVSGHYLFKDSFYLDSGFIAFLVLLEAISKSGKKLSETIKELTPYVKGAEINFEIDDKERMINIIKERYSDGKQDYLDGLTVEYKDWWFNVRPSNTEPLLRLTIEANNQKLLKEKQKELSSLILS
jgi:phosphomannomutase